jgi:hypothetical protein
MATLADAVTLQVIGCSRAGIEERVIEERVAP